MESKVNLFLTFLWTKGCRPVVSRNNDDYILWAWYNGKCAILEYKSDASEFGWDEITSDTPFGSTGYEKISAEENVALNGFLNILNIDDVEWNTYSVQEH